MSVLLQSPLSVQFREPDIAYLSPTVGLVFPGHDANANPFRKLRHLIPRRFTANY
ncbi:hypothetical protein J2125_000574 [Erwinia toletana]|uniref:Uncharacterized protein n=1 Tax=Winslowiella toletana TaxID=92490 RepID=A0ABS4P3Z9_9GAMM|nr:hypothetical protein [Winslowiella toletana]MBP2167382.1 hypothetical protein [Winslowiella toletana]